jgi:hypothetical protein
MDFSNLFIGSTYLIKPKFFIDRAPHEELVQPIKYGTSFTEISIWFFIIASKDPLRVGVNILGMPNEPQLEATVAMMNRCYTVKYVPPTDLPLYIGWSFLSDRFVNMLKEVNYELLS